MSLKKKKKKKNNLSRSRHLHLPVWLNFIHTLLRLNKGLDVNVLVKSKSLVKFSNKYKRKSDQMIVIMWCTVKNRIVNKVNKTQSAEAGCLKHLSFLNFIFFYSVVFFTNLIKRRTPTEYNYTWNVQVKST